MYRLLQKCTKLANPNIGNQNVPEMLFSRGKRKMCGTKDTAKTAKAEKDETVNKHSKDGGGEHLKSTSGAKSEKGGGKVAKEETAKIKEQLVKVPTETSESSGVPRVAINGFGRIGRMALRAIVEHECPIEIVAINDASMSPEYMAYSLKYDSTHGQFIGDVDVADGMLVVDGKNICTYSEDDPSKICWKEFGADYIIESTGKFSSVKTASCHLKSGAKHVIVTTPCENAPMYVMGVNHDTYDPSKQVVSSTSCTINALAPLVKVVHEYFGVQEALISTIQSASSSQNDNCSSSLKSWREGRGVQQNIIPDHIGASKAIDNLLPELKGKLSAISIKVPTPNVSLIDLTCRLCKDTTMDDITCALIEASNGPLMGILGVTDEEVVSSDFIGTTHSCTFDSKASVMLNKKFVKLIAWYDNEYGYTCRVIDLLKLMHSKQTC